MLTADYSIVTSGRDGHPGYSGVAGASAHFHGQPGGRGQDALAAERGVDADPIQLSLEREGELVRVLSAGRFIGSLSYGLPSASIYLEARGGKGGDGGNGGEGGRGAAGKSGESATTRSRATDGENGGDGGAGGDASNGANGGRGGDVTVCVPAGQSELLMLINSPVDVSGGIGGTGGRGGLGGRGGRGGLGGKLYPRAPGRPGEDGWDGLDGSDGGPGIDGYAGQDGHFTIVLEGPDQCSFPSRYELYADELQVLGHESGHPLEPGSLYELSLLLRNQGVMALPKDFPVHVSLMANTWVQPLGDSLALSGGLGADELWAPERALRFRVPDEAPSEDSSACLRLEAVMEGVNKRFEALANQETHFAVGYPAKISSLSMGGALPACGTLDFSLLAKKIAPERKALLQLELESDTPLEFMSASGELRSLDEPWTIPLEQEKLELRGALRAVDPRAVNAGLARATVRLMLDTSQGSKCVQKSSKQFALKPHFYPSASAHGLLIIDSRLPSLERDLWESAPLKLDVWDLAEWDWEGIHKDLLFGSSLKSTYAGKLFVVTAPLGEGLAALQRAALEQHFSLLMAASVRDVTGQDIQHYSTQSDLLKRLESGCLLSETFAVPLRVGCCTASADRQLAALRKRCNRVQAPISFDVEQDLDEMQLLVRRTRPHGPHRTETYTLSQLRSGQVFRSLHTQAVMSVSSNTAGKTKASVEPAD